MAESRPEKKPYLSPEIADWGTMADLTAVGSTNPGDDQCFGSVDIEPTVPC